MSYSLSEGETGSPVAATVATPALVTAEEIQRHLTDLGHLLVDCVHAGASIGFIFPFTLADAETFWRERVLPQVAAGHRLVLFASMGSRIVGTVQLGIDMPANQPHRAEVAKLLVHPDFRRRGIARSLMREIEIRARDAGRRLLTLDTRTGDRAEPLYAALGYRTAGVIPGYCLDPSGDRLDSTTVMYKTL